MAQPTAAGPHNRRAGLRRTIWLPLILILLPVTVYGSDATGQMRFANCNVTNQYRLTLTRYRRQNLEKVIELELPADAVLVNYTKDWLDVVGMACVKDGPCETLAGKIQAVRIHGWTGRRKVSGNFTVELKHGDKLQGSFEAKYIRPPSPIICE